MGRVRKRGRGGAPDAVKLVLQREHTVTCTYSHGIGILIDGKSSQLCNYQFLLNWIIPIYKSAFSELFCTESSSTIIKTTKMLQYVKWHLSRENTM